ncbi:MAG: RraA family protein [Planctomycetaceae bacterium]
MAAAPALSPEVLAGLEKYDTPTVCNVIELFNIRPRNEGYMNETIKSCFPKLKPMVGFALTSTFRSQKPPRGGDVYASIDKQLSAFDEIPGPPVILFQDLDEPTASATFGEVMCTTYKEFGSKGLITSGTGRDLDQVEAIDFPCFTAGTTCAHGYCHIVSVNIPVTVGGITVYPGELLHGDCNGVTTIPVEIASEVPDACKALMEAEDIILNYTRQANKTVAGFTEARKACADEIAKLGKRLRGES